MADNTTNQPLPPVPLPSDAYAELPSQEPGAVGLSELPELDLSQLSMDLAKESLYGNRPGEALAGEALSTATLGLSDVVAEAAGVPAERLREVRAQSPGAAAVGTGLGIIGPALVSGGTSLAAQGASAGFKAANLGGKAAQEAIKSVLKDKVRGEAARKVLETAARGAGEGAIVGVGEAISDAALERKEFTAENVVASAGAGALLGAGFGAAFGTAAAAMPVVKPGFTKLGTKLKDSSRRLVDPADAVYDILAVGPAKKVKLKGILDDDELVDFWKAELKPQTLTSKADYVESNLQVLKTAGQNIEKFSKQLDDLVSSGQVPVTREDAYAPMVRKLEDLYLPPAAAPRTIDQALEALRKVQSVGEGLRAGAHTAKIVRDRANDLRNLINKKEPFSFTKLNKLRQEYGAGGWQKNGMPVETEAGEVFRTLYRPARQALDSVATRAEAYEPAVASALKAANKNYHIAKVISGPLSVAAEKGGSAVTWADAIETGVLAGAAGLPGMAVAAGRKFFRSTVAKNLTILADLRRQQEATQKLIDKSLKNFLSGKANKAKTLASPQVLVHAGFAINPETKKPPKNRQEGFKQVSSNINSLVQDPDLLASMLAKTTSRIALVSPIVAQEAQATLARGVAFLSQKLPRDNSPPSLFQRPYQPSEFEIAKFERYLQAVEQPLSVLEDLEQGTLTREHVEALQAVYPEIYNELKLNAMQMLAEEPSLVYNKKLQIATLLDIPGDSALEPDTLMELQGHFAAPITSTAPTGQPSAQNPNVQATQAKSLEQLNISERDQTDLQLLNNRRR